MTNVPILKEKELPLQCLDRRPNLLLHYEGVLLCFCLSASRSLSSNIHSSLTKRRIYKCKDTIFLIKQTLENKKTDFRHATFSLCLAKKGRNGF